PGRAGVVVTAGGDLLGLDAAIGVEEDDVREGATDVHADPDRAVHTHEKPPSAAKARVAVGGAADGRVADGQAVIVTPASVASPAARRKGAREAGRGAMARV